MPTEHTVFVQFEAGVAILAHHEEVGAAAEAMIDEGGPVRLLQPDPLVTLAPPLCSTCGGPTVGRAKRCLPCGKVERASRAREMWLSPEVPAEQRAAERRAQQRQFRLYCFSCGRSTTVQTPPRQAGRCESCGGSMLTELESD